MYLSESNPGIVLSESPVIETYQYSSQGNNQTFTLNLTNVPVSQYRNYGLIINGSLLTYVYPGTGGLNDLLSGLSNFLNNYGFFWSTVTNGTTLTLMARVPGTNYSVSPGLNMDLATITQTVQGVSPFPLTPGTLLFYDINKDSSLQTPYDHKYVTTYNQVSGVTGFNLRKHCAGMVIANPSNVGFESNVVGSTVKLLRNGLITYRNYGTLMNRTLSFTFNGNVPTQVLPGGALGGELSVAAGLLDNHILPMSYTVTNQLGVMRISL